LYDAGHMKGKRSFGGVWGGQYASYHHNLYAHLNNRAIRFNGARAHDTTALIDYRNNVVYNWGNANACYGGEVNINGGVSQVNIVNNYYKPGPAQPEQLKFVHASYQAELSKGTGQWYVEGNIMDTYKALTKKNEKGVDLEEAGFPKGAISGNPFPVTVSLPVETAEAAYDNVLKYAGAIFPKRDAVDERVISETKTGKATGRGVFGKPGIIDSPGAVGGWPEYKTAVAPADTDNDGMPDEWEVKKGLDPKDPADRNKKDVNGYTMLERYLNELVELK
jgi:hypothetical protein